MPVIGFLGVTFPHEQPHWLAAFRQGLHDTGFIEGENVLIEYRWADDQYNRLSELASDLVRRHVSELDGRVSADGDKMTNELVSN